MGSFDFCDKVRQGMDATKAEKNPIEIHNVMSHIGGRWP